MHPLLRIVYLGLLLWVEPATAIEFSLRVSIHKELKPPTPKEVQSILNRASTSTVLQQRCGVQFKLDGPIEPFTSERTPKDILGPGDLEAVHSEPAHVKIVRRIQFCKGEPPFQGCAFRPNVSLPKTMIVVRNPDIIASDIPILWAHEFGHTRGLHHRVDDRRALMTACKIKSFRTQITQEECTCFREGPAGCGIQAPAEEPPCNEGQR